MLKSYPQLKFSFVEFSLTHMTFPAILAQTYHSLKTEQPSAQRYPGQQIHSECRPTRPKARPSSTRTARLWNYYGTPHTIWHFLLSNIFSSLCSRALPCLKRYSGDHLLKMSSKDEEDCE